MAPAVRTGDRRARSRSASAQGPDQPHATASHRVCRLNPQPEDERSTQVERSQASRTQESTGPGAVPRGPCSPPGWPARDHNWSGGEVEAVPRGMAHHRPVPVRPPRFAAGTRLRPSARMQASPARQHRSCASRVSALATILEPLTSRSGIDQVRMCLSSPEVRQDGDQPPPEPHGDSHRLGRAGNAPSSGR